MVVIGDLTVTPLLRAIRLFWQIIKIPHIVNNMVVATMLFFASQTYYLLPINQNRPTP